MEKQTLGEIASQKLLEMIQRDGYTAGDKLPTEAELVELLGVDVYKRQAGYLTRHRVWARLSPVHPADRAWWSRH